MKTKSAITITIIITYLPAMLYALYLFVADLNPEYGGAIATGILTISCVFALIFYNIFERARLSISRMKCKPKLTFRKKLLGRLRIENNNKIKL